MRSVLQDEQLFVAPVRLFLASCDPALGDGIARQLPARVIKAPGKIPDLTASGVMPVNLLKHAVYIRRNRPPGGSIRRPGHADGSALL